MNGSIDGAIARTRERSIHAGANASREKTYAWAGST